MSFISPEYVLFFAVVVPLFFVIPARWRWAWLLLSSYVFYAYGSASYLLLIASTSLIDYVAALRIDRTTHTPTRRLWLVVSLVGNLGVLFLFKYFNFFAQSAGALLGAPPPLLHVVLPVGISFYTFQSLAYTLDVYRGRVRAERHAGIFATYVAFFPQLVAGPIERAGSLLPQFRQRMTFDAQRAADGFRLILWGLFKKVVIADRLAIYANAVYNDVEGYTGLPLIVATLFFGFQIYCDFSAYSDIAIGTARVMGFSLMQNFRQPYFARSVREFWARWHISLSTWFRDYLYIPLGGNRVSLPRNLLNLFIVFVVSGLWHGAAWTFVIWGALHGLFVVADAGLRARGLRLAGPAWLKILTTYALVNIAWVFFRANSLSDALYIIGHAAHFTPLSLDALAAPFAAPGVLLPPLTEFALAWGLIGLLLAADALDARAGLVTWWARRPALLRWAGYYGCGAAVLLSGLYGVGAQPFIYFQF